METGSGLELLATLHWIARSDTRTITDRDEAVRQFQAWNDHKRRDFKVEWIKLAWQLLNERGWMPDVDHQTHVAAGTR
jgi:hypothetical protein